MRGLALTAAIDHSSTTTTLLKRHLAGRLVKLVELAAGVGASDELPGQLHIHPVVRSQGELWYSKAMFEAELDEEVYERALASQFGVVFVQTVVQRDPR